MDTIEKTSKALETQLDIAPNLNINNNNRCPSQERLLISHSKYVENLVYMSWEPILNSVFVLYQYNNLMGRPTEDSVIGGLPKDIGEVAYLLQKEGLSDIEIVLLLVDSWNKSELIGTEADLDNKCANIRQARRYLKKGCMGALRRADYAGCC